MVENKNNRKKYRKRNLKKKSVDPFDQFLQDDKEPIAQHFQRITLTVSSPPSQSTDQPTVSSPPTRINTRVACGEASGSRKEAEEIENDELPSTSTSTESLSDTDIDEILKLCDDELMVDDDEKVDLPSLRDFENRLWAAFEKLNKQAQDAESSSESEAAACRDKANIIKRAAKKEEMKNSFKVFNERSKITENHILCDLHSQHKKEAMAIFEAHMWFVYYIRNGTLRTTELIALYSENHPSYSKLHCIRTFTVSTGHCQTRDKVPVLKNAVIEFLKKKKIAYKEVNDGAMSINIEDIRKHWWTYVASDESTSESE